MLLYNSEIHVEEDIVSQVMVETREETERIIGVARFLLTMKFTIATRLVGASTSWKHDGKMQFKKGFESVCVDRSLFYVNLFRTSECCVSPLTKWSVARQNCCFILMFEQWVCMRFLMLIVSPLYSAWQVVHFST